MVCKIDEFSMCHYLLQPLNISLNPHPLTPLHIDMLSVSSCLFLLIKVRVSKSTSQFSKLSFLNEIVLFRIESRAEA